MKAIISAKMILARSACRPRCPPTPRSEGSRTAAVQGLPRAGPGGFHPRPQEGRKSGGPGPTCFKAHVSALGA
eukprot:1226916-Alexandrium_andersonii.AAC.1